MLVIFSYVYVVEHRSSHAGTHILILLPALHLYSLTCFGLYIIYSVHCFYPPHKYVLLGKALYYSEIEVVFLVLCTVPFYTDIFCEWTFAFIELIISYSLSSLPTGDIKVLVQNYEHLKS